MKTEPLPSPLASCSHSSGDGRPDYVTPLFIAHRVHIILTVLCFGLWLFFFVFFLIKKKKEVQATKGHGGLLALVLTHVKAGDFCLRMAIRDLSKLELRALNCKEVKMGRVAVIKK